MNDILLLHNFQKCHHGVSRIIFNFHSRLTSVAWRLQWWTTWRSCWQHQEVVTQTITRIIWLHIFGIILDSKCPFKEVLKQNSKHVWEWPKTTIYFTWRLYIERTFWWWWTMLQIRPWVCIYFCCVGIHVKNLEISLRNLTILELPMPLTQKSYPRKPLRFWTKFCPKKLDLSVNAV